MHQLFYRCCMYSFLYKLPVNINHILEYISTTCFLLFTPALQGVYVLVMLLYLQHCSTAVALLHHDGNGYDYLLRFSDNCKLRSRRRLRHSRGRVTAVRPLTRFTAALCNSNKTEDNTLLNFRQKMMVTERRVYLRGKMSTRSKAAVLYPPGFEENRL